MIVQAIRGARLVSLLLACAVALAVSPVFAEAPEGHEAAEHAHGEAHEPNFDEFNMWQGFLGESKDAEPGFLWRKPGTPPPFGAMLLNTLILFYLLVRLGGPKLSEALKSRKKHIVQGMDQAAEMKADAEGRLRDYEEKLAKIDEQIEQAKKQIHDLARVERERVLRDAREKRDRMEREARLHIDQELKAAGELLRDETVRKAVQLAQQVLAEQATQADEHRLQAEYLTSVKSALSSMRGRA